MKKHKKVKPINRSRWADDQVVPEDFKNEVYNDLTFDKSARISFRERIRFSYLEKLRSFSLRC